MDGLKREHGIYRRATENDLKKVNNGKSFEKREEKRAQNINKR